MLITHGRQRKLLPQGALNAKISADTVNQAVNSMTQIAEEIYSASQEQETGTQQINAALMQLYDVIQSNARSSEEPASTAEELRLQSNILLQSLSTLKTGAGIEDEREPIKQLRFRKS